MYGTLLASLSAAALMLAANETLAGSVVHGGRVASAHPISRPAAAQTFRHHRRNNVGTFWPGGFYGPDGEPTLDATQPASADIHYTVTNDVPWDWAHRYPPAVAPSDRPYVSSCPTEIARVLGRDGREQTVNITRCY